MCEDIISPLLEVLGMICSFLPVYDVAALEMVSFPLAHLDVDILCSFKRGPIIFNPGLQHSLRKVE